MGETVGDLSDNPGMRMHAGVVGKPSPLAAGLGLPVLSCNAAGNYGDGQRECVDHAPPRRSSRHVFGAPKQPSQSEH